MFVSVLSKLFLTFVRSYFFSFSFSTARHVLTPLHIGTPKGLIQLTESPHMENFIDYAETPHISQGFRENLFHYSPSVQRGKPFNPFQGFEKVICLLAYLREFCFIVSLRSSRVMQPRFIIWKNSL